MAKETIPAEMFEARCLALLDEVAVTGKQLVITMRGRPIAKIVPVDESEAVSSFASARRQKHFTPSVDENWDQD